MSRDIFPKLTYKWPRALEMMINITNNQGIYISRLQWDITSYSLEWLLTKREEIISLSKDVEKRESLCPVCGKVDWCSHYGSQDGDSSNTLKIKLPYVPAIPHLDIYLKETKLLTQKDTYPHVYCRFLHNCSPMDEWIKYMWYIYILYKYTCIHIYRYLYLENTDKKEVSKRVDSIKFYLASRSESM